MVRTECAGCGHGDLTVFADLGHTALADCFPASAEAAKKLPRYALRAAICTRCDLAQLLDVVPDDLLYGEDYGFRTAGSPSTVAYMAALAKDAIRQGPGRGLIIEIGANDGTLLGELISAYQGRDLTIGVDPSGAPASARHGLDKVIVNEPWGAALAKTYEGKAGLIVGVNVAAHVKDPHDFLEGVALALRDDGVAVIEFQYLPDLLAGCMFDLIYHEHRFFYSVGSFRELAAAHGLRVRRAVRTPQQGGSFRLTLAKGRDDGYAEGLVDYERRTVPGLLAGFADRAWYARTRIIETVSSFQGRVYGYAASAKSCTLLNWCLLDTRELPFVVDATAGKIGRFTPGSAIPIIMDGVGKVAPPDAYLLLASNYLGDVVRREQAKGYRGKFIVPLPVPVIV